MATQRATDEETPQQPASAEAGDAAEELVRRKQVSDCKCNLVIMVLSFVAGLATRHPAAILLSVHAGGMLRDGPANAREERVQTFVVIGVALFLLLVWDRYVEWVRHLPPVRPRHQG